MTSHRKTKEIRSHRRLAIISDFSLLAPPAGLEPSDNFEPTALVWRIASNSPPVHTSCEQDILSSNSIKRAKQKTRGDGVVFLRTQRQLYSPAASYIASQLYLDFVQVIFALQVWKANGISLSPTDLISLSQSENITLTNVSISLKTIGKCAHLLTTKSGSAI